MSAVSSAPYNVSLLATSPLFSYVPSRDGDVAKTWNASYANRDIWSAQLSSGAGPGYRRTQYAAAELALDFEGTGIYACFTSNGARYTFTLDGSVVQQHDNRFLAARNDSGPCTGFDAETLLAAPELDSGSHGMRLRVQASRSNEFHFFGGMITLEVTTKGYTVDDVIVDDQDPRWAFAPTPGRVAQGGTWDTTRDESLHSKLYSTTGTFDCIYNSRSIASYEFAGAGGIVLHGIVWHDSHSFSVTLDGITYNMDATSSWLDGSAVFLAKGNLDPAVSHTLEIVAFNPDDPECSSKPGVINCCVGFDSLILLQPGDTPLPPVSSSTPTGTALLGPTTIDNGLPSTNQKSTKNAGLNHIAGPVAGSVVGLLALIALAPVIILSRSRRRQKLATTTVMQPGARPTQPLQLDSGMASSNPGPPTSGRSGSSYGSQKPHHAFEQAPLGIMSGSSAAVGMPVQTGSGSSAIGSPSLFGQHLSAEEDVPPPYPG